MTEELPRGQWSEDLGDRIIAELPELEGAYREALKHRRYQKTETLVIFENLLNKGYIINLLRSGENAGEIRRLFGLLESMCSDEDHRVRGVAVRCVFEELVPVEDWRDLMSPHLGDLSRQIVRILTKARNLWNRMVNERLFEVFPELEEPYLKELKGPGDEEPGPHTVYGELMNPHVRNLLESGDQPDALKRAFDFVEAMCGDEDKGVQEVAVVTVLEGLEWNPDWREAMSPYLGPLSTNAVRYLASFWRGESLDSNHFEQATDIPVEGWSHSEKALNSIGRFRNIIRDQELTPEDLRTAKMQIEDLEDALGITTKD